MNDHSEIGVVILAAGASARFGTPKQSLSFAGETLLRRAVRTAIDSRCRPVVVTLGANAEVLREEIKDLEIEIAINENYKLGMSGSIRRGLEKLLETNPQTVGVIIMVCDQPFVSAEILARLIETYRANDAPIVACAYNQTLGVPAFFSRAFFPHLLALEGDAGAKKIINEFSEQAVQISFPEGAFDVDTFEDYEKLSDIK
ncbi:MAG: nucleotidyltransferase family protein [Pyrinomonadaceae bacterium]